MSTAVKLITAEEYARMPDLGVPTDTVRYDPDKPEVILSGDDAAEFPEQLPGLLVQAAEFFG